MDKEHTAIARLKEAARTSEKYYGKPLIVTTSGGKDSSVCVELARRAGIDFELMHNHTTADAPETVLDSTCGSGSTGVACNPARAAALCEHGKAEASRELCNGLCPDQF